MANDFGTPGRPGSAYERPAARSAGVGRSPVSTPKGPGVQSPREHSQGTRGSGRGAH